MVNLEYVYKVRVRPAFGLFYPLFDSFCGGSIRKLIQPPQKEFENQLKRTEKSTEPHLVDILLLCEGFIFRSDGQSFD